MQIFIYWSQISKTDEEKLIYVLTEIDFEKHQIWIFAITADFWSTIIWIVLKSVPAFKSVLQCLNTNLRLGVLSLTPE